MADNINVTAGSGKTIGADEISSVLYQRIKIVEGADGTNDGDVSATNPLPVELRDVDTTLVADVGAIKTSVQTIDDAIYTAGSGTPSKGTLALGSDGTNPRAIAVDASGNVQVDIVSGSSAGTQYTEGDTDASITGTAALVEGAADALAVLTQPLTDTQLRASDVKITLDGESVPVTGTFWQATQPVSGTVTVDQATATNLNMTEASAASIKTAVEIMDDWDESDRAKVNVIVGQAGITAGAGAVAANTPRVTHASDDPVTTSVQLLDDTVATTASAIPAKGIAISGTDGTNARVLKTDSDGELQVDVLTLPNVTIGAAIPAGANNIGDVDVLSIAAGDNNIGNVDIVTVPAPLSTTGNGTAATALRVTVASDSTGVVGLATGSNAIGKLAANSGVDIGDVDVLSIVPGTGATNLGKAEDAAHTSADVGVMSLGVRTDVPNAVGAGATGDYSFVATDMAGGVRTALYETDFAVLGTNHVKKYYTNAGAVTDGIVWSPAAGKRWYITDLIINVSAAATVTLEDDKAGGDEAVMKFELAANSGVVHSFTTPLFSGEDAADLIVTTSAGNVYITVTGYEI